ncbi:MAG: outer membrane protein assembly factor BamC [Gammaproteobacteria bacterium]|uniref:outer membrane protein assembly factor BamC n=1 Tax=Limnobacter sp. TaxID=2003368 RepID=UPI001D3858D5|nr:outer membrane protein assembly factor BamC [Limnobacter sp.]MBU0782898.1 outer membrane protein assembly factor BamC [Gammaproteobacteria bacterium]MBU0849485.1 outer membrane protein assembly factor BamC [Gammaproteobacteria bacterium]MBU1268100.1 outer membrane protein assembly factor BamC [Gammaproteobacteria bacterium]MBU1528948.1 outer membrane protein assembly factor BamC [Gammaproteobacteria bacterium]MBU1779494.1 outer membrane protein assembly factor BamC [Gammaproteobacteria bact
MELNKTTPYKLLLIAVAVSAAAGCASYKEAVEGQKTAYRTAEKREQGLEVPPDLTAQSADEQFLIPGESGSGAVSATEFYSGGARRATGARQQAQAEPVLVASDDVKIKRVGNLRSLEVKMPPEQLWPKLREFWKETGFELSVDDPKIGLMETNWAENRANIPMDGIRKVIGTVFDGIYSSNTRDRYRTRVEPIEGGVEIFVTHRGMEENYTDQAQSNLIWMNRPSDPELEAEMLNRLMAKLTGDEKAAAASGRPVGQELISVQKKSEGTSIVLAEDFPLAWRRVGFGLDRAGFIVEDRDRSNGVYYVKYIPDSAAKEGEKKGFFGKIFGGSSDDKSLKADQRFQVVVAPEGDKSTSVKFTSERGAAVDAAISEEAATKLAGKLR